MLNSIVFFLTISQSPRMFVEPAKVEKFYTKGKTYTEIFTVEIRNFPAHVEIYVEDFFIKENGDFEFKKQGTYNFSLAPFISINPRSFDMEPGDKREVRVSFTLPDTMKSYEKWCMLIFRSYPKRKKIPLVQIVGEIGTPIYAILPEGNVKDANLIYMGRENKKVYFVLENFSPIHLRTNGKIYLIDKSNRKIFEKQFSNLVIMPFKKRKYLFDIPGNINRGKYSFFCEVDYGGAEILKGEKEVMLP